MSDCLYLEALTLFLHERGIDIEDPEADIEHIGDGYYGYGSSFKYEGATFHVLDDCDRDAAARESLGNYVYECVLDQIPENLRFYFDESRFIEDAIVSDGYGHILNGYDRSEWEIQVGDDWYFIYPEGAF